jgi:hypothetical protein
MEDQKDASRPEIEVRKKVRVLFSRKTFGRLNRPYQSCSFHKLLLERLHVLCRSCKTLFGSKALEGSTFSDFSNSLLILLSKP